MSKVVDDQDYSNLFMNTNEDLRTFRDGVLIWGGADANGNLIVHKIGTPKLTDADVEVNEIITKEDVEEMRKKEIDEYSINNNNNNNETDSSNMLSGILILILAQVFLALEFMF